MFRRGDVDEVVEDVSHLKDRGKDRHITEIAVEKRPTVKLAERVRITVHRCWVKTISEIVDFKRLILC